MIDDLKAIFSDNGLLSKRITNYCPRDAQLKMALEVAGILQQQGTLLCEAGTGTGKTFAYLVPAILFQHPVVISTGTRNLQDQLFYKDLPVIAVVLEPVIQRQLKVSLLKGRGNYVCRYRFNKAINEGWYDEQTQVDLQIIRQSLRQTEFADISEFTGIKEQSSVWPIVTSTTDNCLGAACPDHDDCYVLKAREQALEADIIIVNHHLLMADLKLKKDSLGELLPTVQAYIIDEAHQLPDIASRFFSRRMTSGQIKELFKDIKRAFAQRPGKPLVSLMDDVRNMLDELALVLRRYRQKGKWSDVRTAIKPLSDEIAYLLKKLTRLIESMAADSAELENCYKRSAQLCQDFEQLTGPSPEAMIHWFECRNKGVEIHLTPLSMGEAFKQQLQATASSWIFTSATLAVNSPEQSSQAGEQSEIQAVSNNRNDNQAANNGVFHYFSSQLSLSDTRSLVLESPFDYRQQVILYAPQNLPMPAEENYTEALVRTVFPLIEWLQGRTFFLFTSYRAMKEARDLLVKMDFNLLVQGDAPKQQLVDEFKSSQRAILLGTSSFWEGVDVKGQALSCVIIDKLPFASPHDPVMQAKINHLQEQGINPFYSYQLPQAAMALKQGVGRLIRDVNDYGVLVIADPRLYCRSYGYYLRKSLPEMAIESDFEQLKSHFNKTQGIPVIR